MCGILAHAGKKNFDASACLALIAHRGPDASSVRQEGGVTFGHRRLSIIDTDARSNQPLTTASGKTTIVFNGEIYNYASLREELVREGVSFRTKGDTEVIVEGYERHGVAFFNRLRGMWALALHDQVHDKIIMARDPFGIKPLVYAVREGDLYLASELRCLKACTPLTPDPESYAAFYALGYFIAPQTPYKEARRLRPGEILSWNLVEKRIVLEAMVSRYMQFDFLEKGSAVERLERALFDTVEAHYVADVPVSLLLSGGTDSSLIAALSKKLGKTPTAYHVAVEGSTDTPYAQAVASHLGLSLNITHLTADALSVQYDNLWSTLDEPTGDTSILPTSLVYEHIRGNAKVVLSGEGGDELFGGYLRHQALARHTRVGGQSRSLKILDALMSPTTFGITTGNPLVARLRTLLLKGSNDLIGAYLAETKLIDYPLHDAAVRAQLNALLQATPDEASQMRLALDLLVYLPNDLLPKSDNASMTSSIEARVPFVDRVLATTIRDLGNHTGAGPSDKRLLKEVLARHLPHALVYRPKSGFGVPLEQYALAKVTADFHEAAAFHREHAAAFGVPQVMCELLSGRSAREAIVRKFPRFAFALISNHKLFGL